MAKNTTNTSATIKALPNKGKINWGTLKGKPIIDKLNAFNTLRKESITLRKTQASEEERLYMKYPGYFKKDATKGSKQTYICKDRKLQVAYNEERNAMDVAHKNALKKDREKYEALYNDIMSDDLYKAYTEFATYAVDKSGFKEQVYKYLVSGLGVKGLTKQGLESFTQTICDAVGLKLTSDATFAKSDRDIEPMNKATFYKTVVGVTRDILIEKNVIKTDAMIKDEDDTIYIDGVGDVTIAELHEAIEEVEKEAAKATIKKKNKKSKKAA